MAEEPADLIGDALAAESSGDLERRLVECDRGTKRLRAELSAVKAKYQHAVGELEEWEHRSEIIDAIQGGGPGTSIKKLRGTNTGKSSAILVMCDWHSEEKVDPKVVNGINEYNLDIAAKRIRLAFQKGLELIDSWRRSWPVDELVLALLGDHITGYIHEELVEGNFLSPTEALLFCTEQIHDGIGFLKAEGGFSQIIIPTAYGNHGRTTPQKRVASGYSNSFEWLMYRQLESVFASDPTVHWQVSNGYHNWVKVQDRDVRMHHGDDLRYNGGVGGITIPVNKAVAAWNQTRTADLDLFGHWHTFLDTWNWVSCGCAIGFNAYAISIKASYQPPTQTLVMMTKRHGKVAALPVYLE